MASANAEKWKMEATELSHLARNGNREKLRRDEWVREKKEEMKKKECVWRQEGGQRKEE
jgi:hypothetical protein